MTAIDLSVMTFDSAKELTAKIRTGTVDLWQLVVRAHDGKAWAALAYPSFAEYCRQEFSMSKQRAYQLIDYAHVREMICAESESTTVDLNERQVRELKPLKTVDEKREAFATAQANAEAAGEKLTAEHVEVVVEQMTGKPKGRAKRNGTAAEPEPPPHAPGQISDAELDTDDKGDPVWLSTFHFRDCDEAQQIKAAGLFFNDMKLTNQVLVTALYMSALSPEQLRELGKRIDFGALMEASK